MSSTAERGAFVSQDLSDLDAETPDSVWFEPQLGMDWVTAMLGRIRETPGAVPDAEDVMTDLEAYLGVFQKTAEHGI